MLFNNETKTIHDNNQNKNYDEIEVSEVPEHERKEGEVIIQIAAAGINFVDLLYVSGCYLISLNSSLVRSLGASEVIK